MVIESWNKIFIGYISLMSSLGKIIHYIIVRNLGSQKLSKIGSYKKYKQKQLYLDTNVAIFCSLSEKLSKYIIEIYIYSLAFFPFCSTLQSWGYKGKKD